MGSAYFVRRAITVFVLASALGVLLFSSHSDILSTGAYAESGEHEQGPHVLEALQREIYLASRHGVQFGVPPHAIPNAMSQMHAMESAMVTRRASKSNPTSSR